LVKARVHEVRLYPIDDLDRHHDRVLIFRAGAVEHVGLRPLPLAKGARWGWEAGNREGKPCPRGRGKVHYDIAFELSIYDLPTDDRLYPRG